MGVEMAEICLAKVSTPPAADRDLRYRCSVIREGQADEVRELQKLLKQWYSEEAKPMMDESMLAQLRAAQGEQFDIMLSEMFIEHHAMQIQNCRAVYDRVFHYQLTNMCLHMVAQQEAEIKDFQSVIARHGAVPH